MNLYISDLHFGHANVIKHDSRPFSDVDEMDRVMMERWNATVDEDDDVYVVGDFSFRSGRAAEWYLSRLKGRKHLIVGNHDWRTLQNDKAISLFVSVDSLLEIEDNGKFIVLCHYPFLSWNKDSHGSYNLHGHSHNHLGYNLQNRANGRRQFDVGVDANEFKPVSLEAIVKFFEEVPV